MLVELVHFISVAHVAFNSIENFMFTRRILNDSLFSIVIVVNVDIMLRRRRRKRRLTVANEAVSMIW